MLHAGGLLAITGSSTTTTVQKHPSLGPWIRLVPHYVLQYVLLLWVCWSLPEFQISGQVVKVVGRVLLVAT